MFGLSKEFKDVIDKYFLDMLPCCRPPDIKNDKICLDTIYV